MRRALCVGIDDYPGAPLQGCVNDATAMERLLSRDEDGSLNFDTMLLTSDVALQTGLANRIGTLADAQAWAAEIAGFAPLALQHAKRVLNDDGAYEDPRPEHQEMFDKAWASQDVIEAQVARIEKRPPNFKGA